MKSDQNIINFDNAATTCIDPEVMREIQDIQENYWGNPSSIHSAGQRSKVKMEQSRRIIASMVGAKPGEIFFTSGGTESDNLAVIGAAMARKDRGNRIISSRVEHPAVLQSLEYLSRIGFEVDFIDIASDGTWNASQISALIRKETILVSLMAANNETGQIFNLQEIHELIKGHEILFHTDAVQAFGKTDFPLSTEGPDLISLSGHKIYGPKGIGVLYIRQGMEIEKQMFGGTQEANIRAGTENLAGIAGFAAAVKQMSDKKSEKESIRELRDLFESLLIQALPEIQINCAHVPRLYSHSNVYFPEVSGDVMLMGLDMAGIAVSAGSACSSGANRPSHVLSAMGFDRRRVSNSIRFSFGRFNHRDEVDYSIKEIQKIHQRVRSVK